MKLRQGQMWKCGDDFVRIVHLERLAVAYKSFKSLKDNAGKHQQTSKKDFCRMLKGATLLADTPSSAEQTGTVTPAAPKPPRNPPIAPG